MKKIYIPDHFGNTNAEKWSGKLTFFEKYNIMIRGLYGKII
jgi:hypothetical protein